MEVGKVNKKLLFMRRNGNKGGNIIVRFEKSQFLDWDVMVDSDRSLGLELFDQGLQRRIVLVHLLEAAAHAVKHESRVPDARHFLAEMRHQTRRLALRRQRLAVALLHRHQRLARRHRLRFQVDHDQLSVALLLTDNQIVRYTK